jgi:type VI secretion system protein ImpJ
MQQLQPVMWTKGVLLTPQHLQAQDRFFEDLIHFQLSALTFCPWGFARLTLDHEALAGGVCSVTSAAGIFPDGLLFDIPEADTAPSPRPVDDCWDQDQETLDVFLAIPEFRRGGLNVSSTHTDRSTRYSADVLMRRDENSGLAEKAIQVARKNFRLLVEGESLEGNSALPVARLRRIATGGFELEAHFVPPLIDFSSSEYLVMLTRRLVELLSAKSTTISATRRQKNQSLAQFGVTDVANFWLLYTVNTYVPHLRHLLESRRGHPAELYAAMMSLASALTTFSQRVHPRDLPTYNHSDLAACFSALDEQLRELLETVVPAYHVSLPMRSVEKSLYATALDDERYLRAPALYLAVSSTAPVDTLKKIPQLVKVSAADRVQHLIKQALPGVVLTHVPQPPSALPVKLDYQYFALEKTGSEWRGITLARNLAAYVPAELTDPQLELLIVLPKDEQ